MDMRDSEGILCRLQFLAALLLSIFFVTAAFAQGKPAFVQVTGEASVEIADYFDTGEYSLRYFIIDKQSRARTEIYFPGPANGPVNEHFRTGNILRVNGNRRPNGRDVDYESLELLETNPTDEPAQDGPTAEAPVATAETRKIVTILVDFNDAAVTVGANAPTLQNVKDIMFHNAKNVSHFYDLASLGTLTIPSDPNATGGDAVYGPYSINYDYLGGNSSLCLASTWASAALTEWENATGYSRSDYRHHHFIVPNYWDYANRNCTWGGVANVGCGTSCYAFSADPVSILHGVIIHELGHNFTLGHARTDLNNDGSTDCEYCDESDMMGGDRAWMKFNPPHHEYVDWYDPINYELRTITPTSTLQTFNLIPIDEEDTDWPGLRALKTTRDGSTNYYISWRQQTGYYNNVNTPYTSGASLHWTYNSGSSAYASYYVRQINPGETFVDATADLVIRGVASTSVTVDTKTTNVFTVEVCNSTCATLLPPMNLVAAGTTPNTINLTWEDFSYNEDGITIEYSPDGSSWVLLDTVAANATSYLHFGLSTGSTFYYRVQAYRAPSETSDWSNTASATTPPASGTFGFPVITSNDDVEQMSSDGWMYFTSGDIDLGLDSWAAEQHHEGLRFQNVAVPQGSTINSAYIRYRSSSNSTGTSPISIRVQDSDNAPAFGSTDYYLDGLTFAATTVAWSPGTWSGGSYYQTPDLTAQVQPIINKVGWAGGNAMAFVNQGTQSGTHAAYSYDNGSGPATLFIGYTWTPPGPQAPVASFTHSSYNLNTTFTDTSTDSDGTVVGWSWNFGDTESSALQNPVHTYAADGTYTVTLTVTDNDADTDDDIQSVTVVQDVTNPIITVLGSDPVLVTQGGTYGVAEDAGATASDNQDGDITGDIVTGGLPVDTSTLGDKTVTYDVTDGSGNSAAASRTVSVVVPCTASKAMTINLWETFSLPCMPLDPSVSSVFTTGGSGLNDAGYGVNWVVYVYENLTNVAAGRAQGYSQLDLGNDLEEGKGYYFYTTLSGITITVNGDSNSGADIPLRTETIDGIYNLVGNPHNGSVDWNTTQLDNGGTPVLWGAFDKISNPSNPSACDEPTAQTKCFMSWKMYRWGTGQYNTYNGENPTAGTINAFDAIWVRAHMANILFRIPAPPAAAPPAEATLAASTAEAPTKGNKGGGKKGGGKKGGKTEPWYMRLLAESGTYRDEGNWIGQADGAKDGIDRKDLEEWAPFGSAYLTILFTNPLFDEVNWGYTTDIRKQTRTPQGEWPFEVRASSGISEVTLSWEGIAYDFNNALLIDEVSGETITVVAGETYTFAITGGVHAFRLVIN